MKLFFDECNQPYYFNKGIKYYGCPNCGASFTYTCFCGTCNNKNNNDYIEDNINNIPD